MNILKKLPIKVDEKISIVSIEEIPKITFLNLVDSNREYLEKVGSSPWLAQINNLDDVANYYQRLKKLIDQKNKLNLGLLFENTFVGEIKFHLFDWDEQSTEIGYWLGQYYQGNGIVHRALEKAMTILNNEDGVRRFEAQTTESNLKSINVLNKLGFKKVTYSACSRVMQRHRDDDEGIFYQKEY